MKLKRQWVFLGLMISGALVSCTDYVNVKPEVVVPTSVKFSANIIPIFDARCNKSPCHAKGAQAPDLTAAQAYTSLTLYGYVDPDAAAADTAYARTSDFYQIISTGPMKDKATDQDRALILKWIQEGALDN